MLSEFRARLVARDLERKILDLLLDRLKGLGLVSAGGRQRTDSTHVLAAIRGLNRLELAGETVRAALEALAAAVPGWLAGVIGASWQQVYGARIDNLHLPASETARGEAGGAVRPGRLSPAGGGACAGRAGLAAGAARRSGSADDLDAAVLPGAR